MRCVGWTSQSTGWGGCAFGTPTRRSIWKRATKAPWSARAHTQDNVTVWLTIFPTATLPTSLVTLQQGLAAFLAITAGRRPARRGAFECRDIRVGELDGLDGLF